MASSLYSNAQHVDFDSVLAMDDPGMVSMFEALMASGLRGFLGCPAVVYEDALVDFFENASVRNGVVFSTVGGQIVKITEKLFAESFELPVEGFGELSEMPKDAIFDARSIVSLSGEKINLSGRKNQMKMPYRLLCDIVAKAISVKAGSFNAITVEKFSLMTVVVCGVKMNWAKFLFGVLKKMFSVKSKQAKGFAIQISLLLATFPDVELGEASAFPASKILSKKTVLRFISINDRDGAEEIKEAAKKKAVSTKRTAADIEAAVPKKKRSLKKKSISSLELVEVAEEALVVEPLDVEEPRCASADAVDLIIQQRFAFAMKFSRWFLQRWIQQKCKDKDSADAIWRLAIAKRCRLHKLVRQRFAFAMKFSRWFLQRWIQQKCKDKDSADAIWRLAIAKRCRLHKLIERQRFAFAKKISRWLCADGIMKRNQQDGLCDDMTSRELQWFVTQTQHKVSRRNVMKISSRSEEPAAKQLTIYEELSKLDVNC
ncbi:hypothetical protein F511_32860 [Dorcoceras hygrometricum]|uniref:Dystroglycan-like n=1 Tax=Dorcoceras hygrometricum TaxID=472368 RepID=A0A2Z7CSW4_9LAMI|nr:hypothetical protein F511_32860 [Dorcoceras hygrometricum]